MNTHDPTERCSIDTGIAVGNKMHRVCFCIYIYDTGCGSSTSDEELKRNVIFLVDMSHQDTSFDITDDDERKESRNATVGTNTIPLRPYNLPH